MEEDGYLVPDGRKIRHLRKGKGWKAEDLASKAGLGLDTIKSAERSEPKQVGTMTRIASALGEELKTLSLDAFPHPPVGVNASKIKTFRTWAESERRIASAKKSIVIIDSFFSEFGRLGLLIQEAVQAGAKDLKIRIYMTSPEKDFGAQRIKEKGESTDDVMPFKESLSAELSDAERDSYEDLFHHYEDGLRQHIGKYQVDLQIYEYPCMPSIRIIAVDGTHFMFGWFPLLDQNPGHISFHLENSGLTGADVDVYNKLTKQIENIEKVSEPARHKNDRARRNRRGKSPKRPRAAGL